MTAANMPAAEVDVTEDTVRALLAEQVPELADRSLSLLANGWDNVLFRLGDDLVARLPRREVAVALVESEQRWLPELAPRLPLPIPTPVHDGRPGAGYPWPWSIVPYVPGEAALARFDRGETLADPIADAERLGEFFVALHRPAPADAPENPYRGVPLAARAELNERYLGQLSASMDVAPVRGLWRDALTVPDWDGPPLWLHGDPHPGNIVLDATGRLVSLVDFGDITSGDRASDLSTAWLFLPAEARSTFRAVVEPDDDTWARAFGWAISYGLVLLAGSADNPPYRRLGRRILDAVLDDPVIRTA